MAILGAQGTGGLPHTLVLETALTAFVHLGPLPRCAYLKNIEAEIDSESLIDVPIGKTKSISWEV